MPVLREQDFDKMATRVVDQFLAGHAKLANAAAKEAMDAGLNPDQIERLAQSANTMAFLRMMDDRKKQGAEDLTHEFDPIDSKQVIKIVIDASGVHVVPSPGMDVHGPAQPGEFDLPDEMAAHRAPPTALDNEKAETTEDDDTKAAPDTNGEERETPKAAEFRLRRRRKLAAVLEDELTQLAWPFEDACRKLTERFKRASQPVSFAEFEKDAMAEYGDEMGVVVLNLIRHDLRLPILDAAPVLEKCASLRDHHVSLESPELRMFETLVKIAHDADKLRRSCAMLKG